MKGTKESKVAGAEADELHRLKAELADLQRRRAGIEAALNRPNQLAAELAGIDQAVAAATAAVEQEQARQRLAERKRRWPEHVQIARQMIEALKQLRRAVEAEAELIDELDRSCGFGSPFASASPSIGNEGRGDTLRWIDANVKTITEYVGHEL
jgi:uncharacterized membrane protein YgaE (UPF0421/DUF939 family)